MTPLQEGIVIGVVLTAIPAARIGRILTAALCKRAGLKPSEIQRYDNATDGESEE